MSDIFPKQSHLQWRLIAKMLLAFLPKNDNDIVIVIPTIQNRLLFTTNLVINNIMVVHGDVITLQEVQVESVLFQESFSTNCPSLNKEISCSHNVIHCW